MAEKECSHDEKTDKVVAVFLTIEEVWTTCDICCKVLKKQQNL